MPSKRPRGSTRNLGEFTTLPLRALVIASVMASAPAFSQSPRYDRVIVFGDSISDSGSYADRAPPGAGKFTTNPDSVWVEVLAGSVDLGLKPHVGAGGTNFAEGGARVATERSNAPGNLSRRSVLRQVDDFLSNDGKLGPNSLVVITGGGNDVFATQANGLSFTPDDLAVLDKAAAQLSEQVVRLSAAGAGTIITTSVPKFEVFNERYRKSLAATGVNALYFDAAALIAEIEADPATYGIVNIKDRACKGTPVESFTCLPSDYVTPDANRTYLFADAVHFTGVVHEMLGRGVAATLTAPSQLSQLPYLAQMGLQNNSRWLTSELNGRASDDLSGLLAGLGYDQVSLSPTRLGSGLESDGLSANLGGWHRLSPNLIGGTLLSWNEHDGVFGQMGGDFRGRTLSASLFGRFETGHFGLDASATVGHTRFTDVRRRVDLGPVVRDEVGDTSGKSYALETTARWTVPTGAVAITPSLQLRYENIELEEYQEAGARSTQIGVSDQKIEAFFLSPGIELSGSSGNLRPYAAARYHHDLLNDDRSITITPSGAPVTFTTDGYKADGRFFTLEGGFRTSIGAGTSAAVGATATLGRSSFDNVSFRATVVRRF